MAPPWYLPVESLPLSQVEDVARPGRQRGAPRGARIAGAGGCVGETDGADAARHQHQVQLAAAQVLRRGQHARGDVAGGDQRVLHLADDGVDAGAAQAQAGGVGHRTQRPRELRRLIALQGDVAYREARDFVERIDGGGLDRLARQAHGGPLLFDLLVLCPLPLLLTLDLLRCDVGLALAVRTFGDQAVQQNHAVQPTACLLHLLP